MKDHANEAFANRQHWLRVRCKSTSVFSRDYWTFTLNIKLTSENRLIILKWIVWGRTEGASRIDRIRNADTRSRMGMNTGIVSRKRQGEYVINAPRSIRMVNIRHSKLAFLEHVYGKRGRKGRKRGGRAYVEDRLHSLILESTYAKIWHRTADVYFVFCTRALLDHKFWIDLLGLVYLQLYSYLCS